MHAVRADQSVTPVVDLDALNPQFESLSAEERVAHALEQLPGAHVLTSSFGAQAAVMLHLVTRLKPRIPVVVIDTGYLFPETYQFIDQLADRLDLNLEVYRSQLSPGWQEARHGRLWEKGVEGIDRYNHLNKVEPMQRALKDLAVGTWFAGIRRSQSSTRAKIQPIHVKDGRYKVHPIFDWSDRDIGRYLKQHGLPYHPLWEQGYVSIGDWHTTRPLHEAGSEAGTRFFGLKRECGLHGLDGSGI